MSNKTKVWKKASEIYAEISELSPKQALAHVYGIENITIEVRKAIITLINAGSQASQYYKDNISQSFNIGLDTAQNYSVGQQLDEYELLEEIGHGGMSQVFKANRINSEQQTQVAIKIFAPKDNSHELLNHFLNEQKILAGLSHPNIVKMLHSGKTQDNTTYLVMELIEEARPLDDFCKTNKSTIKQKIKYIAQCAEALSYSHANLIIHRDLKPDNILINKNKELKIVDFGIAKLINNDLSGNKTTIMALTPSYAAPEQINSGTISVKTDIFSLAVVTLDLLCKENPLPKDRLVKSCVNDEQHIDTILKKLKIDKDLKNILHKALEQQPNKRYSSMQSFADDLNNYLSNNPVNATSQSFLYRVQKFAKRRSALFATMVSFVLFLLIGSILGYQQYKQILTEIGKAQMMKQFMLDAFSQTNPDFSKGNVITAEDILNFTAQKVDQVNFNNTFKFELLQTVGLAYGALGNPTKAIEFLNKSLSINHKDSHSLSFKALYLLRAEDSDFSNKFINSINVDDIKSKTDKARILRVQAIINAHLSRFEIAEQKLEKALLLNQEESNKTEELLAIRTLSELYFRKSKIEKSIKLLKHTIENLPKNTPLSIRIQISNDLGKIYNDSGEYQLARTIFEKNIKKIRKILGDSNPQLSQTLIEISFAYKRLGMITQAQEAADESYQINLKLFGENNINTAHSLNILAALAYQKGSLDKSIDLFYQVVQIFEQQQNNNFTDTLEVKTNLGVILSIAGRYEEALEILQSVYEIQKEKLGESHNSTIRTQQTLARTLSKLGRKAEALSLAESSLINSKGNLGIKHPEYIGALYTLVRIHKENNQPEKALDYAFEITNNQLLDENQPNYHILLRLIAQIYISIKDYDNAEIYYLKSLENSRTLYTNKHIQTLIIQLEYAELLLKNNKSLKSHDLYSSALTIIDTENIHNEKIEILLNSLKKLQK